MKEQPNFLVSALMIDGARCYVTGQDNFGQIMCLAVAPGDAQKFAYKQAKVFCGLLAEQLRGGRIWQQVEKIEIVAFDVVTNIKF